MQVLRVGLLAATALALTIAGSQPLPKQFGNGYQPLTTTPETKDTGSTASTSSSGVMAAGTVWTTTQGWGQGTKKIKLGPLQDQEHNIELKGTNRLDFWVSVNDTFPGSYFIDLEITAEVMRDGEWKSAGNDITLNKGRIKLNSNHNKNDLDKFRPSEKTFAIIHLPKGEQARIIVRRGHYFLPPTYRPPVNMSTIYVKVVE